MAISIKFVMLAMRMVISFGLIVGRLNLNNVTTCVKCVRAEGYIRI